MGRLFIILSILIGACVMVGCTEAPLPQGTPTEETRVDTVPTAEVIVPETSVQEIYWKLIGVAGKAVIQDPNEREAYIILRLEDHRLQGFAGCNILFGSYELNEALHQVKFLRVASTMMACPRLNDESAFLKALEKVEGYSIEEGVLLLQKEGKTVATFEAVYQP